MAWENDNAGFVKIKEGDTKEFTVNEITEQEPHGKINAIPGKSYYYEFDTDIGRLTVNNLGLFSAMLEKKVRKGDRIKVTYVKQGSIGNPSQFDIQILSKADDIQV